MKRYIDKDALVTEIEKRIEGINPLSQRVGVVGCSNTIKHLRGILSFIDTLEVKDPYEQRIQYDSIKAGIQDHAETYSFNIESQLFPQLTKEQQTLWRKEIEQACISCGVAGVELARDPRYKENLEMKEVDFEKNVRQIVSLYYEGIKHCDDIIKEERKENGGSDLAIKILDGVVDARELGIQYVIDKLKAQKGE